MGPSPYCEPRHRADCAWWLSGRCTLVLLSEMLLFHFHCTRWGAAPASKRSIGKTYCACVSESRWGPLSRTESGSILTSHPREKYELMAIVSLSSKQRSALCIFRVTSPGPLVRVILCPQPWRQGRLGSLSCFHPTSATSRWGIWP